MKKVRRMYGEINVEETTIKCFSMKIRALNNDNCKM